MDPMTLLVGEVARSSVLVGEVASMIVIPLAVIATMLVARSGGFRGLGRRRARALPSGVPVVLFCPSARRPAHLTLAATLSRSPGRAPEPALTVADCEYLSRPGAECDFACLAVHGASVA